MPEASTLGYVKESEFNPLEIGQVLEAQDFEILPTSEKREYETALIHTTTGDFSTTSKTVIGQLKSTKEKSVAVLIKRALKEKTTLTIYVVKNVNPENDNVGLKLSLFKPRN